MSEAGSPYSDDLREYYFSNPAGAVVLDTLEFRHPAFLAQDGVTNVAVRFVNDPDDLIATLEAGAPMDAGAQVTFLAGAFEAVLTESADNGIPSAQLIVDNVTLQLMPWMKAATASFDPIEITYRQFLVTDLTKPALIWGGLTVQDAEAGIQRVTATIGYEDDLNKPFPKISYTTGEFAGLAR